MDEVRIRDNSISRNIDLYLEELKREQAAREKRNAERDRSQLQNERTGNGAMSLDDREGAGGEDEEDWEEEYMMLDLDDVFHGAPVPNFAYTLSGLDTLNPILTLDNGLKLIGHYVETIGTVVVYSEKEKEAQTDRWELPPPADPNAVNNEKRPLKRIRGVCKLERKLKFCAMPIACAPARNDMSLGDVSFSKTTGTEDVSLGNAMQTQNTMPTENASLDDARPTVDASLGDARLTEDEPLEDTRPMEDAPLESARPTEDGALENAMSTEDGALENAMSTEDALLRNAILMENTSVENTKLGEDEPLENTRPVEDAPLESARPMGDVSLENARPEGDATLENARTLEDVSLGNAMPTEDTSSK